MAPRTRRSIQRLAAINADFAQSPLPESTNTHNHVQDISSAQHSENSTSKAEEASTKSTKAESRRSRQQHSAMDLPTVFSSKSRLTKIDLVKFFSDEKAWMGLTSDQQAILKAMCPPTSAWGKSAMEQPNLGFLLYDMHWRSDVRAYKENMEDGYYDPEWVEAAEKSLAKSNDGDFDDWKLQKFEEYWGQKMDPDKELQARSGDVTLVNLVTQEKLKIDDEWIYSRSFGRGRKLVTVEHRFHMAGVDDYGKVSFRLCLPARESLLKRSSGNMETGSDGLITNPEQRPKSTKHVKITLEDLVPVQQQPVESQTLTTIDVAEDSELDDMEIIDIDTAKRQHQMFEHNNLPPTKDELSEATLYLDAPRVTTILPKSILKKPSMETFSIVATDVEDLELQVLHHDGRGIKPGKADAWKFFLIRRKGQDIGSLQDLRSGSHKEKE